MRPSPAHAARCTPLEARTLKVELQDSDVAALVRFLASHFGALAADRGIEYTVDTDGPCMTAIDPDKLQRVVLNLLGNAFKFVPDGGRIHCPLRHSATELTLTVDDFRPRREARAAAGDLRAFPAGRRQYQPHGRRHGAWALAIAKEFVEMHKGRIGVFHSSLGGARFEGGCRRDGLEQVLRFDPIVVVSDIMMPHVSGVEIDDLLDVSRIARGRIELKTEIVEVAEVVAKAIEMASPLLEQRNHAGAWPAC